MSKKELYRATICENVLNGYISLNEASSQLSLSYRQTLRVYNSFRSGGNEALIHGLVGKTSNNARNIQITSQILALLKQKYTGFGPTLASEHLAQDDNINISTESLRMLMKNNSLLPKTRKHKKHRSRRQRMPRFGDMLQIDGSFHDWFGTGEKCCLINLIDDATSINLCLFAKEETTKATVTLLWQWISKYGVPRCLYADRKNVYFSNEHPLSKSVFGEICERLNIHMIPAGSPQAKGRIERSNGTHQDRLIKKMQLLGIKNIEEANAYMSHYLQQHNKKFAVLPVSTENAHRKKPPLSFNEVCYIETTRTIANDWTIRYNNRIIQITKQSNYPPAKTKALVRETFDENITIVYRGKYVTFLLLEKQEKCDFSTWEKCDFSTLV